MQYLLSATEYRDLRNKPDFIKEAMQSTINELCRQVATLTKVKTADGLEVPHVCVNNHQKINTILTERDNESPLTDEGWNKSYEKLQEKYPLADYCDNCPVQKQCTMWKNFSQ